MPRQKKATISKDVLYQKYVIENKNTRQVAKELGVTKTCVLRNMNIHDIARRDSPAVISRRYGSYSYGTIKAYYMTRIRRHALALKLEYTITSEYIYDLLQQQQNKCVFTGLQLNSNTASLDRINGNIGYVPDNVQWIHKKLQKMKQNMSNEEFIQWCHLVSEHNQCN